MIPAFAVVTAADSRSLSRACRFTQARAIAPGTKSLSRLGIRSYPGHFTVTHPGCHLRVLTDSRSFSQCFSTLGCALRSGLRNRPRNRLGVPRAVIEMVGLGHPSHLPCMGEKRGGLDRAVCRSMKLSTALGSQGSKATPHGIRFGMTPIEPKASQP